MRWADLDLLGHVNNVVYVDYLQEARVDMLRVHAPDSRADDLAEGVVVVRHEVSYQAPLTFRFRPLTIETWVTEVRAATFTMVYEIFDEDEHGERTTYLLARTVLTPYVFAEERPRRLTADERAALEPMREPDDHPRPERWVPVPEPTAEANRYQVNVRFSDVDIYQHVNNVKYFEYLQESRIWLLTQLADGLSGKETAATGIVVAQTDVDYRVPITFRPEPYEVRSRITRVGATSMVIDSEIRDAENLYARARVVCVFWDGESGRPVPPALGQRERLQALVNPGN